MLSAYGNGKLFGEPYGQSPVRVVFLHGWGRRGHDFADAAAQLALEGIGSVAFDLPGFGSSPLPTVAGGARHYADLLLPALGELGAGPFVFVGHSFGGRIAVVLASRHPELVKSLVLSGVPLLRKQTTSKSPFVYRLLRSLNKSHLVSDATMERARQRYGSTDYKNASGILRDVLVATVNESYEDELATLNAPVVMVWGSNDMDVPVATAQRAASLLAGSHSLRVVNGIGHLLPSQAPKELVVSVKEALQ